MTNSATHTCPVCDGTGRGHAASTRTAQSYKYTYGYDEASHTLLCRNCGGQYMSLKPTGKVRLDREGKPCVHEYSHRSAGRCYHEYTCKHCGDVHFIDSGD